MTTQTAHVPTNNESPADESQSSPPTIHETRDDAILVAQVAAQRVRRALLASPDEPVLFAVFDFDKDQIRRILEAIHALEPAARIAIHPDLVSGAVRKEWISDEPLTHWRNVERTDADRAVVSAVSNDALNRLGETAATIYRISPDHLKADVDAWFDASLHLRSLEPRHQDYLHRAIRGLLRTDIPTGVGTFAQFMLELDDGVDKQASHKALNRALTVLRMPPEAPTFAPPGDRGRLTSPESWATQLSELYNRVSDVAYLRNDKGSPLERPVLQSRLDKLIQEGEIQPEDAAKFQALLDDGDIEPGVWTESQEGFVTLKWSTIQKVIKTRKTTKEARLGQATMDYVDREAAGSLSAVDRDILERLDESRPADAAETALYGRHRTRLEKDRKLARRWEQFIFREVRAHADLEVGLLRSTYELLSTAAVDMADRIVLFRLDKANELDFWRQHVLEASVTLRDRYRGLDDATPDFVRIDCGICWTRDWAGEIDAVSDHQGKDAEFRFEVYLLGKGDFLPDGAVDPTKLDHAIKTQMIWTPTVRGLGVNFPDHLRAAAPPDTGKVQLLCGRFSRTAKDTVSGPASLKLAVRETIGDINATDGGQLFDPNDPTSDMGAHFASGLADLSAKNIVSPSGRSAIEAAYTAFAESYGEALKAFLEGKGAMADAVIEQARRFGQLLHALRTHAYRDACKRVLWTPVMTIGIALSRNSPGAIVTPLSPFRLAEIGLRARMLKDSLDTVASGLDDKGLRSFVLRAEADLQRSWFSDFAVLQTGENVFVSMTENQFLADYSYVEPAAAPGTTGEEQGAHTKQAADNLMKVLSEHLDLHPHNAANFSVVLYNSESRDLPSAVAERLARRVDEDTRLRCDLIIASDDRKRLRQLYAEQNVSIGRELDSSGGADLTKEFLSNLRVGIGDVEQLATSEHDNKPLDIAFLQDVFARNAGTHWRRCATRAAWPDVDMSTRAAPSRRLVHGAGENRTRMLLASPTRPECVQRYLDLAMEMASKETDDPGRSDHWEPVREISFDHDENAKIIRRAHDIADWVVTFDTIADRRLFRQNGISVIRSVPIEEVRHNLVVSTCAHRRSLSKRLAEMLADVTARVPHDEIDLARTLIDRAADLSGQIVLRAANRDTAALELIGLSLSEQLIRSSVGAHGQMLAWFFLDDFKTRFGHLLSDPVADLLLVSAREVEGRHVVTLTVVESKYVGADGLIQARSKSRQQTESSMNRLRTRYGRGADRLNAAAHAAQLADLLVEHGSFEEREDGDRLLERIAQIRALEVEIEVTGVSLVFVHDEDGPVDPPVMGDGFLQMFFNRPAIASLLEDVRGGGGSPPLPSPPSPQGPPPAPDDDEGGDPTPDVPPPPTSPSTAAESSTADDEQGPVEVGAAMVLSTLAAAPPTGAGLSSPDILPKNVLPSSDDAANGESASQPVGDVVPNGGFRSGVATMLSERPVPPAEIAGQEWLQATERRLKTALKGYGLTTEVVGSRLTPNSALIRFRGSDEMTTDLVQKRTSTLLTSHGLEIVAVRPAKGEVVVMVARDDRITLPTLDVWKRRTLPATAPFRNTSFVLGEREDTGEILYLNLGGPFAGQPQHGPHTLIAGETGGGKGVFTANLLLDICSTNSPTAARIRLVDPKAGIDYGWIEQVPHLDGPIIVTAEEAIIALKDLVGEMERRYTEVLAPSRSPNLDAYNAKVDEQHRLPRIYFFHDELADWMADKADGQYRDAVSEYVVRLSGKARAAGIHLFLITQRPDKDALPGLIKANMNNKIALKVSNRVNSQIILDEGGAEGLLGHGHMIARLANQPGGLIYAQAPYLDPEEASAVALGTTKA